MNDVRSVLGRGLGSFSPDQGRALEETLRRVRHRERHGRRVSAVIALGVVVGTAGVLAIDVAGSSLLAGPAPQSEGELPACWTFGAEGFEACRGDIVDVASGSQAGEQWSLRLASAVATTPGLDGANDNALLCWSWEYARTSSTDCLAGVASHVDSENRAGIIVDHSDGTADAAPQSVYMGPTPAETARVTLSSDDGDGAIHEATLFGPYEGELGTDAKVFLGFTPPSAETTIVTVIAYDSANNVLWAQEVPWFTD